MKRFAKGIAIGALAVSCLMTAYTVGQENAGNAAYNCGYKEGLLKGYRDGQADTIEEIKTEGARCAEEWDLVMLDDDVTNHMDKTFPSGTRMYVLNEQEDGSDGTCFIVVNGEWIEVPLYIW